MFGRRQLVVIIVALVMGVMIIPVGATSGMVAPTQPTAQATHPSNSLSPQSSASKKSQVTLITGQTVTIMNTTNGTHYSVDADVPMQKISTKRGTYIFPTTVDFSTFSPSLFNIDLLRQQNLTDSKTPSIPVIITGASQDAGWYHANGVDLNISPGAGYTHQRTLSSIQGEAGVIMKQEAAEVSHRLQHSPHVARVYLDKRVEISLNDAARYIRAPTGRHQYNVSGNNITVAVLDSGVDETHPDLDNGTEILEKDFTTEETTKDRLGHGTHVAGIITGDGEASNGTYVGIAPNASIMDLRVLNSRGVGRSSWIIDAIEFAAERNADVISLSIGGPAETLRSKSPFTPAIRAAVNHGSVVVVAAGNSGPKYQTIASPGIVKPAITVGATDLEGDAVAPYSSRGPTPVGYYVKPDLVAPGTGITSAASTSAGYTEPYVTHSGTSMATPMVSAAAALLLDAHPGYTPLKVKSMLTSTSHPVSQASIYSQGAGQIDVPAALNSHLIVLNSTIDFGTLSSSKTATRTFTLENTGSQPETLSINVSISNLTGKTSADAWVNQSTIKLSSGEQQTISLSVDPSDTVGIYSGTLRITNAENVISHRAIFGFARAHSVTVTKTPLSPSESVANDVVLFQPHASRTFGQPHIGSISNGQVTFTTFADQVSVYSFGISETTSTSIITANTATVTSDTSIHLSESKTARYNLSVEPVEQNQGPLVNLALEHTVQQRIDTPSGDVPIELAIVLPKSNRYSVRTSHLPTLNTSIEGTFVEKADLLSADAVLDVPDVYLFHYATAGVAEDRTFRVQPDRLATMTTRYHRTSEGQTYLMRPIVRTVVWGPEQSDVGFSYPLADRQRQTIHVTPSSAAYAVGAQSSVNSSYQWKLIPIKLTVPRPNQQWARPINQHPYMGRLLAWNLTAAEWKFIATFQVSQGGGVYADEGTNTVQIRKNGEVFAQEEISSPVVGTSLPMEVHDGTTVTLRTIGFNNATSLSTQTITTYQATYEPRSDTVPPILRGLNVRGLNSMNTVENQPVHLRVRVSGTSSNVTSLTAYAGDETSGTPFETGSGWRKLDANRVASGVYNISFSLTSTTGKVDIAIRATDEGGNVVRSTVHNAFRVNVSNQTPPPINGYSNPPTDPDNDGEYEDVNGDGAFTIVDIQALFTNYRGDVIQAYPELFDYNDTGDVSIVDVQKLFKELSSG